MQKQSSCCSKLKQFKVLARLGQGSFGQVFKVQHLPSLQTYALKRIKTTKMSPKDKEYALNQIRVLASCEGPYVIGYMDSFFDEEIGCLCLVLEYAELGDLAGKVREAVKGNKMIEEQAIWRAMAEIGQGLGSLHENKIMHRDLKPANIFIMKDGTCKIGDLNISRVLKYGLARTQTGTPYYTSPQIWKNVPYGNKVDLWSLGCVLYEMAAKRPPFLANSVKQLKSKVLKGSFPRIPACYSEELSNVITSLLQQNPDSRLSIKDLLTNPVVVKNCKDFISNCSAPNFKLLNTIKLQQKNWKKLDLPKPKYNSSCQKQEKSLERNRSMQKIREINVQRPISARDKRVSVASLKSQKEQQKIRELRLIKNQEKNKERILSACGPERARRQVKKTEDDESQQTRTKGSLSKQKLPPKYIPVKQPINIQNNKYLPPRPYQNKENLQRAGQKLVQNSIQASSQNCRTVRK